MTLYDLKPRFQALLRPLVKRLYDAGITANQVTLMAMIMSLILGLILAVTSAAPVFILLPFFLFIRMALNAIDGMLAREYQQQSKQGALLNEIGDVVSDMALYLPFALLAAAQPWLIVLTVFLACLTEFCGILAQTIGANRRYDGPLGKSDRAFLFGTYGLLIAVWPQTLEWINVVFTITAMLLLWTCFNRCYRALRQAI